jgi:murein DD-endopeptidase MepM/ murein hydrolase activator NlpD
MASFLRLLPAALLVLLVTAFPRLPSVHVVGPIPFVGPRPLFQMPVACGEMWKLDTYSTHDDFDIDFMPTTGTAWGRPIYASYNGRVVRAGLSGALGDRTPAKPKGPIGTGAGYSVVLDHGQGWRTYYFHMIEPPMVHTGQKVTTGQQLGKVGSTGKSGAPHIHYEQLMYGAHVPYRWGKVESYFDGVPSGITSDGNPNTGPLYVADKISPARYVESNNCGLA